jgi:ankyrin repeat protein
VLRALLAAGANVNTKGYPGTPLIKASGQGRVEMVQALIAAGADVNASTSNGETALMAVAKLNESKPQLPITRALLDAKADPNAKDGEGVTALMLAAHSGHLESVKALLAAKADVNAKARGFRVLEWACGHEDALVLMRRVGPDKITGFTALMIAVGAYQPDVAEVLLQAGADVNAKAGDGSTALMLAMQHNDQFMVRRLTGAGAK